MSTLRRRNSIVLSGLLLCIVACSRQQTESGDADSLRASYWRTPLAAQGEAPTSWTDVERSLSPHDCGQCHPEQYADWQSSIHAGAFSPGFVGQLLGLDAEEAATCMECHARLDEQRRDFERARLGNLGHEQQSQGLAAAGNSCAGCHVRGWRYFGPVGRDTGMAGQSPNRRPHGGVYRTSFFESSAFCKVCHQFPSGMAVNGKPLENTFVEWRESPYPSRGVTCQTCHMPQRRHLWRGIHDPDMVAEGLSPRFLATEGVARFELENTGVGHAFPTYVRPKVVMRAAQLDGYGNVVSGTEMSHVIQRRVESIDGQWVEHSDTRLFPGETAALEIAWGESGRVRMWLEVHPDDFYDHDVFDILLERLDTDDPAADLIAAADRRASSSAFRLFDTDLRRPPAGVDGAGAR